MVATGAGQGLIGGQQGIEKQVAAQVDLLRTEALTVRRQGGLQAADALVVQRIVLVITRVQLAGVCSRGFKAGRAYVSQGNRRFCGTDGGEKSAEYEDQAEMCWK